MADLKAELRRLYGSRLREVILYGSQARGDAGPDSDIDVMVVLDGPVEPMAEIKRALGPVSDLCLKHETLIACMFTTPDTLASSPLPLYENIRREGIVV